MAVNTDKRVALSVSAGDSGVSLEAESVAVSRWDRVIGGLADRFNIRFDRADARERSVIEARERLMKAATDVVVQKVTDDPELAIAHLRGEFERSERRYENKKNVLIDAVEHVRSTDQGDIPTEETGTLSIEFSDRFERYAEDAATDNLREKWSRVLAEEVKSPGTFSNRVLRTVDEMDSVTAHLFEKFCRNRIESSVPRILSNTNAEEVRVLEEFGLVSATDVGYSSPFGRGFLAGAPCFSYKVGSKAIIAIPETSEGFLSVNKGNVLPRDDQIVFWNRFEKNLSIPVYALTNTGRAISGIIDTDSWQTAKLIVREVRKDINTAELLCMREGEAVVVEVE